MVQVACLKSIVCQQIQQNGYTVEVVREGAETVIPGTSMIVRGTSIVFTGKALIEPVEGVERELYGGQQLNAEKNRIFQVQRLYRVYFCGDDITPAEKDDIVNIGAESYRVLFADPVYFQDDIPLYEVTCSRIEND